MTKLVTIGVYGFTSQAFFKALQDAGVDTFCDIRGRRGVRGAEYAFANSARLQARLDELQIRYLHFPELAPPLALRQAQAKADKEHKIARRKRTELSDEFIAGYEKDVLAEFDSAKFLERLPPESQTVALFCVEREPAACHRSLVAERLHHDLSLPLSHLKPTQQVP